MNKERIINYLYGEMTPEEERIFAQEMKKNRALAHEVKALQQMRKTLRKDQDTDPVVQPIILPQKTRRIHLSKWWAIAASLLALMVVGKLLGLQYETTTNGFAIHYGNTPDVEKIKVEQGISEEALQLHLANLNDQFTAQIEALTTTMSQQTTEENITKRDLNLMAFNLQSEIKNTTQSSMQQLQADQENQMESIIDELVAYIDVQRQQDLQVINASLNNLALMIQASNEQIPQYVYQQNQK